MQQRRALLWTTLCCLLLSPSLAAQTLITDLSQITDMAGSYKLAGDIAATTGVSGTFTGTLDGDMHTIRGLTTPLFEVVNGATIRNVMLEDVQIANHTGNTGGIVCRAGGASRIYNCGILDSASRIGGTGYTGSIAGVLNQTSRVINCFSYATITGGSYVGGIVGYNNNSSNVARNAIRSLVVNCMFYGNITGGTWRYPIYAGIKVSNAGRNGLNNYNYFRQDASMGTLAADYNCALAAEERFLRRWEFYRGILNSNRALVAYYISGNTADTALVAKWVQADGYPYPILKRWGRYPSQINSPYVLDYTARPARSYDCHVGYDIDYGSPEQTQALDSLLATHYCGAGLGTLSVSVNRGSYGSGSHAAIVLPVIDMDTHTLANRYDYCFRKVQLPYYNDLFAGNYSGGHVVTGWKITAVEGNSRNTFAAADADNGYNYADTTDTGKDLYGTSQRVFAQGGYYYVPEGVTAITLEAYWGNAIYVSDPYYDKVYDANYGTGYNFSPAGARSTALDGQTVYTSLSDAVNAVPAGNTVYDNAIVLVGNVHQYCGSTAVLSTANNRPFTIMSIDADHDDEPDCCLFYQHTDRKAVNPIRFDFLWQPGIGITATVDADSKMPDVGIFYPKGHFEITETAVAHYYEFEYDATGGQFSGTAVPFTKSNAPLILMNGIFEQFTSIQYSNATHTTHILLGGHLWMKEFNNGTHADGSGYTRHVPISMVGGEYNEFYLSGVFHPNAAVITDNAECYVNGGKFGEIAGAGQEQIDGDVTFKINHALIDEFYGGGINKHNPITGNIDITINNSVVKKYCGAAKFGNMGTDKTVTTHANGTVFGTYFGAGNGGTSLHRVLNQTSYRLTGNDTATFANWTGNYQRGRHTGDGIATGYEYEYFVWAGSGSSQKVGRFYLIYASFDMATSKNVYSILEHCLVQGNFYGGGNIGTVDGTATSTLTGTIVRGDAYAGGFSTATPTVDVYTAPPVAYPSFDGHTGLFSAAILPAPTQYTWSNDGSYAAALNDTARLIHTDSVLSHLGKVMQDAKITVNGNSHIYGNIYGGGAMSDVEGNTFVTTDGDAHIDHSVYGGGMEGEVAHHTLVNIIGHTRIDENVYGGGNAGVVGGSTHVQIGGREWQQTQ